MIGCVTYKRTNNVGTTAPTRGKVCVSVEFVILR